MIAKSVGVGRNKLPTELKRGANANKVLRSLENLKADFVATVSNYTTKIDMGSMKKAYIKTMQPTRVFAAYNKVKKDVQQKKCPNIDPNTLVYFTHGLRYSFFADKVINIDLKSAYATILTKDKFISASTAKYINSLPKMERLASVGMLASKKSIYTYKKGEIVSTDEWVSPYAGYFYHCVKKTSEIMREMQRILGENYLFTWADGIYFLPDPAKENKCRAYLKKIDFPSSFALLKNFDVVKDDIKFKITFEKGEDGKTFNLPIQDPFRDSFVEAILTINNKKKHETGKIKIPAKSGGRIR